MTQKEADNFLESINYFTTGQEIVLEKCSKEQSEVYKQVSNFYENLEPAPHSIRDMKMKGFHKNLCALEHENR